MDIRSFIKMAPGLLQKPLASLLDRLEALEQRNSLLETSLRGLAMRNAELTARLDAIAPIDRPPIH